MKCTLQFKIKLYFYPLTVNKKEIADKIFKKYGKYFDL